MNKPHLSIVIPAFNEEKRILPTLESINNYLSRQDYKSEIIVVDDGSSDNTVDIVKSFIQDDKSANILLNGRNRGKGFSVRNGILSAKGEYIFFTDADLSTPIEEIEKCLPFLEHDNDIVIGSRGLVDSDIVIHQPWYREMMGKTFNVFVSLILMKGITDTQCGFKGFKKEAVKPIFDNCLIEGFSFDVEIIYLAKKNGFTIKEIPVRWINSELSKVSPLKHSIQMFADLIKIKLNDIKGKYR